jgi:hypothetical protein
MLGAFLSLSCVPHSSAVDCLTILLNLNYWVMHPVARVSIKYWNNLRIQQSIFLVVDFIVHFSHYMFRPRLAAIFRWFANTKKYLRQSLYIQRIRSVRSAQ